MQTPTERQADHAPLIDLARRHAAQLRSDAIDEFWHGAGSATRRAIRSATRLASSIARHQRLRTGQRA